MTLSYSNFNSIKVRLKLYTVGALVVSPSFQFHKGTIKTSPRSLSPLAWSYFNSIKVRLKRGIMDKKKYIDVYFNSIKVRLKPEVVDYVFDMSQFQFHKGTIKTLHHYKVLTKKRDFNSIKVRLKRLCCRLCGRLSSFQFHKGTIKTTGECAPIVPPWRFQFHKGTIKTAWPTMQLNPERISIP